MAVGVGVTQMLFFQVPLCFSANWAVGAVEGPRAEMLSGLSIGCLEFPGHAPVLLKDCTHDVVLAKITQVRHMPDLHTKH